MVSDADTPPQNGWRVQALPDSWRHNHPGLTGIVWYRIRFDLPAVPGEVMALYVGRVAYTGQLWMNGLVLNPDVRFTGAAGLIGDDTGRWPQLITLPSGLLRSGENVLHIRLQASPVGGRGLWDVRVGPLEQLRAASIVRDIVQRTLPQALFVLMAAASVFGLLVWWRDRRRRNLHFTAAMSLWTVIVGFWVLPALPITPRDASVLFTALYIVFYWSLLALFYRYSESRWRWYPWVLNLVSALTLAAALVLIVFFYRSPDTPQYVGGVLSSMVLLRLLATAMLLQAAWQRRSPRSYALAATEVFWFVGHVQLIAILAGWVQPLPLRLDPAGSLPLYLVLVYLFVDGLIREREQAIRDQQAAISAERARILQDMHDGMGSNLITALRLAQRPDADRGAVASSIAEALEDLRLIIDSMDSAAQGLISMLGNLRYRLQPRLAALGIHLEWHIDPHIELDALSPPTALGVLRIVQEALNNAVQHAQARVITVAVERDGAEARIGIQDDGMGIEPERASGKGRGLSGMRRRAEQLGGRLRIAAREGGGTCVILQLPLLGSKARLEPRTLAETS